MNGIHDDVEQEEEIDEVELLEETTRLHAELGQVRHPTQASLMLGIIMLSFLSLRLPGQNTEE